MYCSSSDHRDRPDRNKTLLLAEQTGMICTQNVPGFACYLLHADVSLGLMFSDADGSDMFLRNIGVFSTDYTALYPRR
jgi:hypothetical protein